MQLLLRLFGRCHVHYRAYKLQSGRLIRCSMRHNMEVSDGTVGHLKPMLQIKVLPGACCQIDRLPNPCSVVRMHSLEHRLDGGMDFRIVSEDPEGFLGPGEFAARDVPAETPGPA